MVEPRNELQRNAIAEARRKELEVYQRAQDVQWLNSRMEDGRMGRCLALIQREAEMEKDFQERTDHASIVNERAKKETALGIEIANVQREEACLQLRRHYLRERDPSLRELERKLQAGYVCRDLRLQILNKEYKRLQDMVEEKQANEILLNALYNDKEAETHEQTQKLKQTTQYCKEIQQQLVNRQLEKQCEYENSLIERKMLEEVVRTMADEDRRELQQKRELTEKTRNEMVTFKKARDAWKEKQKQMVINEERQIEEQNKMVADRSSAIVAERERRRRTKEECNERIVAKILADEAELQERTDIIKLLQEQEYLEKNFQDDIAEREKMERVKKNTKEALTEQMETRKRLEREQREIAERYRQEVETKINADLEKERRNQLEKKQKGKLYSQELLKQMEENEHRRKMEKEREAQRAEYVWEWDRQWQAEVSKERKNMIEEHVPQLLGYLQAGVINKDDIPAVREGANKREDLKSLDIENMTNSQRPRRYAKCNPQCRILREY